MAGTPEIGNGGPNQRPHPVPEMAAVMACVPVLRIDKDLAVSWFCAAVSDDLRIAACEWAVEIFNSAIQSHDNNCRRSFSRCAGRMG